MTPAQREIAAKMIEARRVSISSLSDEDHIAAASFLWDQGVFYLSRATQMEIVTILRAGISTETP